LNAALASYDHAIVANAHCAEAYSNRGNILKQLNELSAALASYDHAIAIRPDYAEAYSNRGMVLGALKQWDAALDSYDRSIAIKADLAEAHYNRANLLQELRQADAACAAYDRAIAIKPGYAEAHFNRSLLLLLSGDYERGWGEYEWRWRTIGGLVAKKDVKLERPLWLGDEPIAGRTIVIVSEQGLGDTLQFCRYVSLVAALGANVIVRAQSPLRSLLAELDGVAQVVTEGEALPPFDYYCPMMSLPTAFKTTIASVPVHIPYLRSSAEKLLYWRGVLGEKSKPRIGLVWSGGFRPNHPELWSINSRRNIPLDRLAVLKHPNVEFYSLQKGQPAESELAELISRGWDGPHLNDHTHLLQDFSDTAALIENLDLVISVDTSTAHLAGALGKPVWILNRFDGCWRWLLDRTDSPWYPTVKLYRQDKSGDWDGVIQRVKEDLTQLVS
jgi:hypothetical protein